MTLIEALGIGPVYWVKRGAVSKRLRIKASGTLKGFRPRALTCGAAIPNSYYSLVGIEANGHVTLRCGVTGTMSRHFVGVNGDLTNAPTQSLF